MVIGATVEATTRTSGRCHRRSGAIIRTRSLELDVAYTRCGIRQLYCHFWPVAEPPSNGVCGCTFAGAAKQWACDVSEMATEGMLLSQTVTPAIPAGVEPPLCVDVDGTLVKSDTLLDAFCQFVRKQPLQIWRAPLWLARGKAFLKAEVAKRAPLDASRLPYNAELLRYLQEQRREGRQIFLATGADAGLAQGVADHLGIFDGVLASDETINLTHARKLSRLKERFGEFDYIGNSRADLPLLTNARFAMLANPTRSLQIALRIGHVPVARTFVDHRPAT